jgi:hypothetical protein
MIVNATYQVEQSATGEFVNCQTEFWKSPKIKILSVRNPELNTEHQQVSLFKARKAVVRNELHKIIHDVGRTL